MNMIENRPKRKLTEKDIERFLRDGQRVASELRDYKADMIYAESDEVREAYSNKWIAVYRGVVRASADTMGKLMYKIDSARLPRSAVVVKFENPEDTPWMLLNDKFDNRKQM